MQQNLALEPIQQKRNQSTPAVQDWNAPVLGKTILLVSRQEIMTAHLETFLKELRTDFFTANCSPLVLRALQEVDFDAIVVNMAHSNSTGMDLFLQLEISGKKNIPVIALAEGRTIGSSGKGEQLRMLSADCSLGSFRKELIDVL